MSGVNGSNETVIHDHSPEAKKRMIDGLRRVANLLEYGAEPIDGGAYISENNGMIDINIEMRISLHSGRG